MNLLMIEPQKEPFMININDMTEYLQENHCIIYDQYSDKNENDYFVYILFPDSPKIPNRLIYPLHSCTDPVIDHNYVGGEFHNTFAVGKISNEIFTELNAKEQAYIKSVFNRRTFL